MKRMVGAQPTQNDLITRIIFGGLHKTKGKCSDHHSYLFQSHLFLKFVFITEMETSSYVKQLKYQPTVTLSTPEREHAQQADLVSLKALGRHPRSVALRSHLLEKAAISFWAVPAFL